MMYMLIALVSCASFAADKPVDALPARPAKESAAPAIVLDKTQLKLKVGETFQLTATVRNSKSDVSWSSFNPGFATVTPKGLVTAVHEGSLKISAFLVADGKVVSECSVDVVKEQVVATPANAAREIKEVLIANQIKEMTVGEDLGIVATCLPYNVYSDNPYTLETSDSKILQVSSSNIATAVGEGKVTLTAKTPNGCADSITFEVKRALPDAVLKPEEIYNVELGRFNIVLGETGREQSIENSLGINNVLLYAKRHGYKKVLFPKGLYLLDPKDSISMRSNLIVDLNGATWQIRPNEYARYILVCFQELDWPSLFKGYDIATEAVSQPSLSAEPVDRFIVNEGETSILSKPISIGPLPPKEQLDQAINSLERGALCLVSSPIGINRKIIKSDIPGALGITFKLNYYKGPDLVATKDFGKMWIRSQDAKLWNDSRQIHQLRPENDYDNIKLELVFSLKNCTADIYVGDPAVCRKAASVLENSSLRNGTILGERDFKEQFYPKWQKDANTEGALAISFAEGRNNGIEGMTVRKGIGFNMASRLGQHSYGIVGVGAVPLKHTGLEFGNLDQDGSPIESTTVQRTKEFIDISAIKETYELGCPLGYMGYNVLRARIYDIYFYDSDKVLLDKKRGALTSRKYSKPQNSKYVKVVLHWDTAITSGAADFRDSIGFFTDYRPPTKNYIRNCIIEDNFSTGMAACGGINWLIEGNTFRRNGGRMPGCDIDWEDGWEYSQDDIVRNNSFESRNGLIVCAGLNHVFKNNVMKGNTTVYARSQYMKYAGNTFGEEGKTVNSGFGTQTDTYICDNTFNGGSAALSRTHEKEAKYTGIWKNNIFKDTSLKTADSKIGSITNNTFTASEGKNVKVSGGALECKFEGGFVLGGGDYEKCEFSNGTILTDAKETDRMLVLKECKMKNIKFNAPHCNLTVTGCDWENSTGQLLELANSNGIPDVIKIENNRIVIGSSESLIYAWNIGAWNGKKLYITNNKITVPANYNGFYLDAKWRAKATETPTDIYIKGNITNQPIQPAPGNHLSGCALLFHLDEPR
ncbi:MAG TPA: hypothetical protein DET40_06995 [Lentisphaeria bacterium]|nr:hypothetical protein [Lentisphaeria bacterium]